MTRQTLFAFAAPALLALACGVTPARAADEPDYPHGDFNEDCSTCHTGDGWKPAVIAKDFRHTARFSLRGAHQTAKCRDCHKTLDFKKTSSVCADCHRDPHIGELGADCGRCHTPRNFIDRTAQLDAHRLTRFPLTGAHVTRDCEECHAPVAQGQLQYVNTPVDCQSCHLPLYQATTNPSHAAAGFPTDCSQCHAPTTWNRARFDHRTTSFPLTGAHTTLPCASCHANGYTGTPTACYACHQADYEGTTDPSHVIQNYPTDCSICHNTTSWQGARFAQHDALYFPIYSGAHNGRWNACSTCHNVPSNFSIFNCLGCHTDPGTSSKHSGVSGYSYNSQACYTCHPTGRVGN